MKKYTGLAKVKEDTTWIYAGHTLKIIGYREEKDGSGHGVFADGAREYVLCLKDTDFQYSATHIYCHDLEVLELHEEIVLPLTDLETLELVQYVKSNNNLMLTASDTLAEFLTLSKKESPLSTPDLSTLYDRDEFERRFKAKTK